ncbi:MAG: LacI family DNA-binding transcriptional regulator [Rhizobiaceae bacterium]|nr:LacI family DNA-binding transcriptional regulator [Rhizobiaceae bacterium]
MAATLADVAKLAGVDLSTASRVLAGSEQVRVRPETRDRIHVAAKDLGYRPNRVAQALRTSKSSTLGLALPQVDNPVFTDMISGVETAARSRGYSILITRIGGASAGEALLQMAEANRVDGVLVISFDSDRVLESALGGLKIPVVMINRRAVKGAGYVVHDSRGAAYKATRYLIEAGHRRIIHLAGRLDGYNGSERHAGYVAAHQDAGIELDPSLVLEVGYDAERAAQVLADYLKSVAPSQMPTAIFSATLVTAAGAIRTLHGLGFDLPRDFSVIGLNDGLLATLLFPQLTTVALQSVEMGRRAAEMIIDQINDDLAPAHVTLSPGDVVVRQSVAPPRDREIVLQSG